MGTITTNFALADVAYILVEAKKGNLVPVIIEKITAIVESSQITAISYQVSSTNLFHNTILNQDELATYADAKALAEDELNEQIDEIEEKINEL
jgi:hypothetical protein